MPDPYRWLAWTLLAVMAVAPAHAQDPAPDADAAAGEPATDPVTIIETGAVSGEPVAVPAVLDLAMAKAIAVRESPTLAAAAERVAQARQRVKQAHAAFFPFVEGSVTVTNTWLDENTVRTSRNTAFWAAWQQGSGQALFPVAGFNSPAPLLTTLGGYAGALADGLAARRGVDNDVTTYGAQLAAQWLLFDGLEREFTYAASRFAADEVEAARDEAERLLLDAVARAYFAAMLAREDIAIATADEDFQQRQLQDAQARRRVGTGSLSDVLNFQVRANTARASRIRAERTYETALIGLAELMGIADTEFPDEFRLAPLELESEEELLAPDEDAGIAYALANRPDLAQREYAVMRTEATAKARRGPFLPSVSASASHAAQETERWFGPDDYGTTVGISVSYTLFAGGGNKARLMEARAARREAGRNRTAAQLTVIGDVREATEDLRAAQKQLWLQRANAQLVQRNRELVEKEYAAGQASLVRLNEAQRDLTQAQAQLALARVTLRQGWHDYFTATAATLAATPPAALAVVDADEAAVPAPEDQPVGLPAE